MEFLWIDLPSLTTFVTDYYSFYQTTDVTLSSIFNLLGDIHIDLPRLTTFTTEYHSFYETTSLSIEGKT